MIARADLLEAVETGRPFLVVVAVPYNGREVDTVISRHCSFSGAARKQYPRRAFWQVVDAAKQLRINL